MTMTPNMRGRINLGILTVTSPIWGPFWIVGRITELGLNLLGYNVTHTDTQDSRR